MKKERREKKVRDKGADNEVPIGLVVVSHCDVAREMVKAATLILGNLDHVRAVAIDHQRSVEETVESLEEAVHDVDGGRGVILLTDLFGGTPTNLSLSFAGPKVAVVCGVNLPMLIKFADCRYRDNIVETARLLVEYGQRHISLASRFLPGSGERS